MKTPVRGALRLALFAIIALVGLLAAERVWSHPHVLVNSSSQIVFNDDGAITEIRHTWTFDLPFSVYAVEGLDANGNGYYSRE